MSVGRTVFLFIISAAFQTIRRAVHSQDVTCHRAAQSIASPPYSATIGDRELSRARRAGWFPAWHFPHISGLESTVGGCRAAPPLLVAATDNAMYEVVLITLARRWSGLPPHPTS